jgi:hypothetical protein
MSRHVIVLGTSAGLFEDVQRTLLADGRFIDGGDTVHCDGEAAPLTNIYEVAIDPVEWDGWEEADGVPDPRGMSTLMFECAFVGLDLGGRRDPCPRARWSALDR